MKIQLIRHATVVLEIHGKTLLVDPMFSARGTLSPVKDVKNQDKNPLVDLPVPINRLFDCDALLLTHLHRDHFDEAAINVLPKDMRIFCQPKDEAGLKASGFMNTVPVKRNVLWEKIRIFRTPARHGHGATALAMAPVSGYVLHSPDEPVVYISGDSIFYSGTKKILERHQPDIAVCNCGEAAFACGRPITMGIGDLLKMCSYDTAIKIAAVHMEAWNHCGLTRDALKRSLTENRLNGRVFVPEDGETVEFRK